MIHKQQMSIGSQSLNEGGSQKSSSKRQRTTSTASTFKAIFKIEKVLDRSKVQKAQAP